MFVLDTANTTQTRTIDGVPWHAVWDQFNSGWRLTNGIVITGPWPTIDQAAALVAETGDPGAVALETIPDSVCRMWRQP